MHIREKNRNTHHFYPPWTYKGTKVALRAKYAIYIFHFSHH